MELNELTRALFAAGYTRERYPDYVHWNGWQNFEYNREHLARFTWETPCGLLICGESEMGRGLAVGDVSFRGTWYCPENNNPMLLCPYGRKDCPHIPKGFPTPHCPCRRSDRPYQHEGSAERVAEELAKEKRRRYLEVTKGAYCPCVVSDNNCGEVTVHIQYDVETCIRANCQNPFCVARQQERDLRRVNVFYDVRRIWITCTGFLEERKERLTRGVKVFPKAVARTDAEIWLAASRTSFAPFRDKDVIYRQDLDREDNTQGYPCGQSMQCGEDGTVHFQYQVENIRIAQHDRRDTAQDKAEAGHGVEVIHASDVRAADAARKREAKRKRQALKRRRQELKLSAAQVETEQITFFPSASGTHADVHTQREKPEADDPTGL